MKKERRYVLILDKERNFIRLFRSDCSVRPVGKVLWEGDGLRRTYDAMKRLNKERRLAIIYYVYEGKNKKNIKTIKVSKVSPKKKEIISKHLNYKEAILAAKFLRKKEKNIKIEKRDKILARRKKKQECEAILLKRLEKVGVFRKNVPNITPKDLQYLEWFEKKNKIIKEVA